jgi:hypothetical protein
MFKVLIELLGYARKLLPLMEIYTVSRASQPVRDPLTEEFQNQVSEVLRANRNDLLELRSALEAVHQRLKVIDDQSATLHRQITEVAGQQRTLLFGIVLVATLALASLVTSVLALVKR